MKDSKGALREMGRRDRDREIYRGKQAAKRAKRWEFNTGKKESK